MKDNWALCQYLNIIVSVTKGLPPLPPLVPPDRHQNCPSRSHAVWELPINELDRREDPDFEEKLTGCALVSSCSNVYTKEHFKRVLQQGRLLKHKHGGRIAPLNWPLHH